MKKSELASLIREEFLALAEATYKVPSDKVDDIKGKLEDDDTVEVTEDIDDIEDEEKAHKAAAKGTGGKEAKGFAAQTTAGLEAHKKREILQKFMRNMKGMGIVSKANKILDIAKYKEEFAKFKAKNL